MAVEIKNIGDRIKKYDIYEDIINFCSQEYGERLITHNIKEGILGKNLWMQIDMGELHYQEYDEVCFPKINNNSNKIEKDYSAQHQVLNFVVDSNLIAQFYLYGQMPYGEYENPDLSYEQQADCFSLELKRVEDLKDIIDFISEIATNPKFNLSNDYVFKEVVLSELIENIFVFIPHFSLQLFSYQEFIKKFSFGEIEMLFNKLIKLPWEFNHEVDDVFEDDSHEKYSIAFDEINTKIEEKRKVFNDLMLKSGDIKNFQFGDFGCDLNFIKDRSIFKYSDTLDIDTEKNLSINIVFRVNHKTSNILFYDFIRITTEGKELVNNLFEKLEPLKLEFIRNRFIQIQYAIEDRINRTSMLGQLKGLLLNEENFKLKNVLTIKRLQHINSYYNEQHKLIEMYKNPLPFVIEKAYRNYVRSDGGVEMVAYGLNILNILIKSRLLFPLEEYFEKHKEVDNEFTVLLQKELFEKKPSDGTFIRFTGLLMNILDKNNLQLECFEHFRKSLCTKKINSIFNEITEIRNRFAHPPYDVNAFIQTLSHYIPDLIDEYRIAMKNIDFLIPVSFSNKKKIITMNAKKLMGFEDKFETVEVTIKIDELENFEVDKLVAYNNSTRKIIPLHNFVGLIIEQKPNYSIGLYDRCENGKVIFQ